MSTHITLINKWTPHQTADFSFDAAVDMLAADESRSLLAYMDSHLVFDSSYDHERTADDIADRICTNWANS
jgi:hypothetical protein